MAIDRPTFSEHWHRVAKLRPRLKPAVQSHRQSFRGTLWHVLADPANQKFFRLDEDGYRFVGLLDGRRTVAEAWEACQQQLGDDAPTQGEVIQLLGQLHAGNLLEADLPPDAARVFERYRKRRRREIGGQFANFLFVRIPLLDPNRFLHRWEGWFGWMFGPVGFILWLGLLVAAGWHLAGKTGELWAGASPQLLLRPENIGLLYLSFAVIKAIHELGHGFACVRFGRKEGVSGAVHTIGIMLLVFMPVPYVDASASWAFRSKWRRAFVGAAGMYVEVAVAAIAAIVWARTADGTLTNAIAYNLILIAGVSTLLFNGNPLLRFDGYYILSDLLEIANLAQRSRQQLYYFVKRYAFGVRRPQSPSYRFGERTWLVLYAIAATIYRVFIGFAIALYVGGMLFGLGILLVFGLIATWAVVPAGKFVRYLGTSPELQKTRGRAVAVTVIFLLLLFGGLGGIPVPDRSRAQGVVEPVRLAEVHTEAAGEVQSVLEPGQLVMPEAEPLLVAHNRELEAERGQLRARIRALHVRRDLARGEETALAQALGERLAALNDRLDRVQRRLEGLTLRAPFPGVWIRRADHELAGVHLKRGERVGLVADPSELIVRAVADQALGPRLVEAIEIGQPPTAELRIRGRPTVHLKGTIRRILPAGQRQLPSRALGYAVGGSVAVDRQDRQGNRAAEPFFEVRIRPGGPADGAANIQTASTGGTDANGNPQNASSDQNANSEPPLRIGQRVVVRFTLGEAPLLTQWWRDLRRLIQKRFGAS